MNCQEVMELMQRQLDDDLEDGEIEVLMNHTRQCPDCAAMFERMKLLSAELAGLPKVMPSYSLVDAIMPELLRIDEQQRQAEAAGAENAAEASSRTEAVPSRSRRKRRWTTWSTFGGVVAAGIVAGILLITYPPDTVMDNTARNKNTTFIAADGESAAGSAIQDQLAMRAESLESAGGDAPANDVGVQSYSNETGAEAGSSNGASEGGESGYGAAAEDDSKFSDQHGGVPETAPMEPERSPFGEEESPRNPAGGESAASPDGQYVASVGQHNVQVAKAQDGSLIMETARKNGQLGQLIWSEDGTELTFEVKLEQGAIEKYVISTTDWSERKASP